MMAVWNPQDRHYSLLITDDNEGCRYSLKNIFEPAGYITHLASCGREAIEIARTELLHALILDMHLPDIGGVETFRVIKKEVKTTLPCIFISGDLSKELKLNALSVDAFTVIPKPINIEMMRLTMEQLIERYY
ncbi:MAG: response regulator [Candidatus Brocadiales bacterium]